MLAACVSPSSSLIVRLVFHFPPSFNLDCNSSGVLYRAGYMQVLSWALRSTAQNKRQTPIKENWVVRGKRSPWQQHPVTGVYEHMMETNHGDAQQGPKKFYNSKIGATCLLQHLTVMETRRLRRQKIGLFSQTQTRPQGLPRKEEDRARALHWGGLLLFLMICNSICSIL